MSEHLAYLLRCADGTLYVGLTDDLEGRVAEHQEGLGSDYTRRRLPVALAWSDRFATREDAAALERQLKGWSRAKKEALIRGDFAALPALARRRSARPIDQEPGQ
ncbi:MAG: GIY-YIG nuclease family protein [Fimbriimonadaceae bacterium]|nr:GIY-YIG nuclease family protein [Fimbriimonadaceae bacterium]